MSISVVPGAARRRHRVPAGAAAAYASDYGMPLEVSLIDETPLIVTRPQPPGRRLGLRVGHRGGPRLRFCLRLVLDTERHAIHGRAPPRPPHPRGRRPSTRRGL
jgi:hypothetical protein